MISLTSCSFLGTAMKGGLKLNEDLGQLALYSDGELDIPGEDGQLLIPQIGVDFQQIDSWLQQCQNEHQGLCQSPRFPDQPARTSSIILIDVFEMKLTPRVSSASSRYFALSYVWGGANQLKLTKALYPILQEFNSLSRFIDSISQVIKDAIMVTKRLGERYLWVDSLCTFPSHIWNNNCSL